MANHHDKPEAADISVKKHAERLGKLTEQGESESIESVKATEAVKKSHHSKVRLYAFFGPHEQRAILAALLMLILACVMAYFWSPLSRVQSFKVTGVENVSKQDVLKASGLEKGQSIWMTLHEKTYFNELARKNNPQIKAIQLSLQSTNTIKVDVTEYVEVGYVKQKEYYYPLLANGTRLRATGKIQPGDLPVYEHFKTEKELKLVLKQFGSLSEALRHSVSEIIWSPTKQNPQRLLLFMNDGNEVLIKADSISTKMKYYPGIASQMSENGIVDLQVGAYATPY